MSDTLKCKWTAIHNFQPVEPPKLTVRGQCTVPTPGFKVTLKEAVPQGFNPNILILDMKVTPPTGIEPQHVTTVDALFEKTTDFHYTEVTILPGDVHIPVEEVF